MRFYSRTAMLTGLLMCAVAPAFAMDAIKTSVVKIYTVSSSYNYYQPWQRRAQQEESGSGAIIAGNLILTNAHVVGDHTFIQVKRAGLAKKYIAHVKTVAHACDLAILQVKDQTFFANATPLELSDLPEVRDKVSVYGFPAGGDEMCITEGVVSRIEHVNYSHSNAYLLACQIDAAINPGNSGGPVIKDDKIVGVAFQAFTQGENVGYMVPAPVIRHFLEDMKDGVYNGIPELGLQLQNMENPDIRNYYGMKEDQTGVLVNKIFFGSPAKGILQESDIILSIDGIDVENDGTIEFRKGERTFIGYAVQKKQINCSIGITLLRNGKVVEKNLALKTPVNSARMVPYEQYDRAPTYYVVGGLLFEPLTKNFLQEWGPEWYNKAPVSLLDYYFKGEGTSPRKDIVVLVKVLADEINQGYHGWGTMIISRVNGKAVQSMQDLVRAFEKNTGPYHVIEEEGGFRIILSREMTSAYSAQVLQRYQIPADRSEDLRESVAAGEGK